MRIPLRRTPATALLLAAIAAGFLLEIRAGGSADPQALMALGANQEVRIARDTIEEMQPSKVSVMPAGLDQQLTVRELADLVAFLKACQ